MRTTIAPSSAVTYACRIARQDKDFRHILRDPEGYWVVLDDEELLRYYPERQPVATVGPEGCFIYDALDPCY